MRRRSLGVTLVLALLSTALVMSCAEERQPINRVQPNVVKKAMLKGEWYFTQRTIDVPGGKVVSHPFFGPSVVGAGYDVQRVRFDIQEDFLYVRRSTEKLIGGETYSKPEQDDWSSYVIMAAYRITSHFDIQRDYNPVTGESMNVLSENTYDRPWWEREYMRVDWSQNLAPGYTYTFAQIPSDPVPYYVQDSCTPDLEFASDPADRCVPDDKAPFFDIVWNEDGSDLVQGYFDITNASVVKPSIVYLEGYGEIPSCYLNSDADIAECDDTFYFTRTSFWKLDPNHDYEPMPYSGPVSSQFGYFSQDRLKFDDQVGVVESQRQYYANRYNLWEQSHDYAKLCRTDEDCCDKADPWECNSICDVYTGLRDTDKDRIETEQDCKFHVTPSKLETECEPQYYCTLPYNQRRVRPIVYYANKEWPEELVHSPRDYQGQDIEPAFLDSWKWAMADQDGEERPVMEQISDQWSAPYVRTINILKMKAAGKFNADTQANVPYVSDDMKRDEPGKGKFTAIGVVEKDANGIPTGQKGADENWYDPERPPYVICRFAPVLGPDNDPNNVEPDVCWERVQEISHCVFNPAKPGVNPKTGDAWTEAQGWPICSTREATPRLGDIRQSFAYWVDKFNPGGGYLGLGPGLPDPVTGEILSGTGHIYQANDNATRGLRDVALLITGDLDAKKYIDGYNLSGWLNKYTGNNVNPTGYSLAQIASTGAGMRANLDSNPTAIRLDAKAIKAMKDALPAHGATTAPKNDLVSSFRVDDLMKAAAANLEQVGPDRDPDDMLHFISTAPEGSAIESELLNDSNAKLTLQAATGVVPGSRDEDGMMKALLITRDGPIKTARAIEKVKDFIRSELSGDFAETGDDAAISTAAEIQELRRQGKLPEGSGDEFENAVWRLLRKKMLHGVVAHEIGHSVGLMHNFGGSQDSINYQEEYWKIRTNGCADQPYDSMAPDINDPASQPSWDEANGCNNPNPRVGLRFINWADGGDPLSQYEISKKLYHWGYGSIMDYTANVDMDSYGLGRYDWAAILFGYGHHFEVYKETPADTNWKFHETLRPGRATADSPNASTIIDTEGVFIDSNGNPMVQPGAKVINTMTGETSTVATVTETEITLATPFNTPLAKGDRYSVWGYPVGLNSLGLNGLSFKFMLDQYMAGRGSPMVTLYQYFYQPHYTEWYRNWVGADGKPNLGFNLQSNRDVRDIRAFDWRVRSEGNAEYSPGFSMKKEAKIRVPYVDCNDYSANISNDCRTWDYGADDYERMHNQITKWEKWYISRSFVRGRVGYSPENYYSNYYDRFYKWPKNFNDIFALYVELFSSLYNERELDAMVQDPYNSWGGYAVALHDGFNMLMQTLATPDAASSYQFEHRAQNGELGITADTVDSRKEAGFDISGGSRFFQTNYMNADYDDTCGVSFWRCLWNVGWYYDKIMALNALSESSTFFIARDTAYDVRLFRISFFDNFNWQLKRYFAGIMGERWYDWAPMTVVNTATGAPHYPQLNPDQPIIPNGKQQPPILWRDWANPAADITQEAVYRNDPRINPSLREVINNPDPLENPFLTSLVPIDPVMGFTTQIYAMVLGMSRFQHNYDLSFYNASRMWTKIGETINTANEDPDDPNYAYVHYFDPDSQTTYTAIRYFGANDLFHPYKNIFGYKQTSVAGAMIEFANKLRSRSDSCDPLGAQVTATTADNCCDDPYMAKYEDRPMLTVTTTDDCPAEYGDPSTMDEAALKTTIDAIAARTKLANDYLARYRGLLDFQVRLTNVYDMYMGMVGAPDNPGNTPGE
ncbi:MAG: zinc-dependent metalloprotease [Deltaproteobacteria bacterium]|nr:zinc-dependent metalloprotease [Deltaproteobacteria bacterium]